MSTKQEGKEEQKCVGKESDDVITENGVIEEEIKFYMSDIQSE